MRNRSTNHAMLAIKNPFLQQPVKCSAGRGKMSGGVRTRFSDSVLLMYVAFKQDTMSLYSEVTHRRIGCYNSARESNVDVPLLKKLWSN